MDTLIAPAPGLAEQRVLGRYRLLERLGEGGFGVVWRARDERLRREVALKRIALPPPRGGFRGRRDDGRIERAQREAQAAGRLSHPAIVALYEAQAEGDAFFLISELVHGRTLAQLIAENELEPQRAVELGATIAGALEHAHARGVIHRDVKPQNILVPDEPHRREAIAKLTDFGGAALAGEEALTRTGDVLGTLAYMSPEQSEGREAGEASDLYSLALVLYEALSGTNPVRGSTPAATARRIGRPVPPLEGRCRKLPRELARAIDTALSPAPERRGTLHDLRLALEYALHEGIAGSRRAGAARPRSVRSALALPRLLWLGLALAVVVWLAVTGRPGAALLALAAAAPLVALPRRSGPGWLRSALAPALGVAGLAGSYPALAAQARRWPARAALGALGYWWLCLAEPLLGRRLWLGEAGVPARAVWEGSAGQSATHVVGPLLSLGVLLGAALWAAGALALPWLVRGRSALLDLVAASLWSAALVAGASALDYGPPLTLSNPSPRGAALGAVLGALVAVAARALRGPV